MSKCVANSVFLTSELAVFVTRKVNFGRYGSASAVIRAGLRLLEVEEQGQSHRRDAARGEGHADER